MPSRISQGANLREGEKRIADKTHKNPKDRTKSRRNPKARYKKKKTRRHNV